MLLRLKEVGDRESTVPVRSFDGPSAIAYDMGSSATASAGTQFYHANKEKFVGININKSWYEGFSIIIIRLDSTMFLRDDEPSTRSNSFIWPGRFQPGIDL